MEPQSLGVKESLCALAILHCLPLVLFALWEDHFRGSLQELRQAQEKVEVDRERDQIKFVSFLVLLTQLLLFLGSFDLQAAHPSGALGIFVLALLGQFFIQSQAEAHLQSPEISAKEGGMLLWKAFLFWLLGVGVNLACLVGSTGLTLVLLQLLQPKLALGLLALIVSAISGVLFGIHLNFLFSPFYLKNLFPIQPLEDLRLRRLLSECFTRFQLPVPDLLVVHLKTRTLSQNILAGSPYRKHRLKAAYLISHQVLSLLSEKELLALVLNQVSYFVLNQAGKRNRLLGGLVLLTAGLGTAAIFLGNRWFQKEGFTELFGVMVSLSLLTLSYRFLSRQIQKQELERDSYTILTMGVSYSDFSTALRKLDSLQAEFQLLTQSGEGKHPLAQGLPETEKRLEALKKAIPLEPSSSSQESSFSQAA
ncbi:MAG: hypothetical protein ACO3A2_08820 [Bdellovibrionia bacterium]